MKKKLNKLEKFRFVCYSVWLIVEPTMLIVLCWFCLKIIKLLTLIEGHLRG